MPSSSRRRATFLRATISPVCAVKRADTARTPSGNEGQKENPQGTRYPQRSAPRSGISKPPARGRAPAIPPLEAESQQKGPGQASRDPRGLQVSAPEGRSPRLEARGNAAWPHLYVLGFEDDAMGALPDATEDAVLVHVRLRRPDPPRQLGCSTGQSVQAVA